MKKTNTGELIKLIAAGLLLSGAVISLYRSVTEEKSIKEYCKNRFSKEEILKLSLKGIPKNSQEAVLARDPSVERQFLDSFIFEHSIQMISSDEQTRSFISEGYFSAASALKDSDEDCNEIVRARIEAVVTATMSVLIYEALKDHISVSTGSSYRKRSTFTIFRSSKEKILRLSHKLTKMRTFKIVC